MFSSDQCSYTMHVHGECIGLIKKLVAGVRVSMNPPPSFRGRPLMIWGIWRRKNRKWIYFFPKKDFLILFPQRGLFKFFLILERPFFPGEGPLKFIFSWRRAFEIYFFLEEGLRNFFSLDFLWPPPRSLMVEPLVKVALSATFIFFFRLNPDIH